MKKQQPWPNFSVVSLQLDIKVLDLTVQKSRLLVKNPSARPPTDPRAILQMPSLEPSPSHPSPQRASPLAGRPIGGLGVGIKLPGRSMETGLVTSFYCVHAHAPTSWFIQLSWLCFVCFQGSERASQLWRKQARFWSKEMKVSLRWRTFNSQWHIQFTMAHVFISCWRYF